MRLNRLKIVTTTTISTIAMCFAGAGVAQATLAKIQICNTETDYWISLGPTTGEYITAPLEPANPPADLTCATFTLQVQETTQLPAHLGSESDTARRTGATPDSWCVPEPGRPSTSPAATRPRPTRPASGKQS